jgi:hypothetical protein
LINEGLKFNDLDNYFETTNPALQFGFNDFSYSFIFKVGTVIVEDVLVGISPIGGSTGCQVVIQSSGTLRSRPFGHPNTFSLDPFNDDKLHVCTHSIDRDGNGVVMVDGETVITQDISAYSANILSSSTGWIIGSENKSGAFYGGLIREVIWHNKALSIEDHQEIYNEFKAHILFNETFDYGADGVVKNFGDWEPSSGTYKINETYSGVSYIEAETSGTISHYLDLDDYVNNGEATIIYNDVEYSDTVANLVLNNAWFNYTDKKIQLILTAGDKVQSIKITP